MEELNRVLQNFAEASDNANDFDLQVSFIEMVKVILEFISEALSNVSDVRCTHGYLGLLHGDIANMNRHLTQYSRYLIIDNLDLD